MIDELFDKYQDLLNRLNCSNEQIKDWKQILTKMSDFLKSESEKVSAVVIEYAEQIFLSFENILEKEKLKEKKNILINERDNCKDEEKKSEIEKQLSDLEQKFKIIEQQRVELRQKNNIVFNKFNQQINTLSEKDQNAFDKVNQQLGKLITNVNAGIDKPKTPQPEPKVELSAEELQKLLEQQRQENERLKKENQNLKNQLNIMQQSIEELKKQLEDQKKFLEEMKNNTLGTKVKNVGKKAKRKVVQVKKWAKANPKKTVAIIGTVALAGLVGSAVIYGHPLSFAGRVVSALWKPLHNVGLGKPLHNINRFLFGKIRGATFDSGRGLWLLNGTPLNDLGAFETILNNVVGMGAGLAGLSAVGYGAYKVAKKAKNAWLNRAEDGFINKMTNKIKSLRGTLKNKLTNRFKRKKDLIEDYDIMSPVVDATLIDEILPDLETISIEELIYLQKYISEVNIYIYNNHKLPEDINVPLNLGTIEEILKIIDKELQIRFDEYIENMSKEELENLAKELEEKFQNEANNNIDYFDPKYGIKLSVAINKVSAKIQEHIIVTKKI